MKTFQGRWSELVRRARQASRDTEEGVPSWAGIRARRGAVVRREPEGGEAMDWWRWYGARGVAVASVLVLVSLIFALRGPGGGHPLRPRVEDAVAEVFWLL